MDKPIERRKRFPLQISLGNIIAAIVFVGSAIGVYTNVIADVNNNKKDIDAIKQENISRREDDKEVKKEIKSDIKDVKQDVRDMRNDLQKILLELKASTVRRER